jgi:hypothetical protein
MCGFGMFVQLSNRGTGDEEICWSENEGRQPRGRQYQYQEEKQDRYTVKQLFGLTRYATCSTVALKQSKA